MRARAVAVAVSLVLHGALVGTLAMMGPPAAPPEELEPARVTLKLTPPEPERTTAAQTAAAPSPAAAAPPKSAPGATTPRATSAPAPAPKPTPKAAPKPAPSTALAASQASGNAQAPAPGARQSPAPARPPERTAPSIAEAAAETTARLPAVEDRISGVAPPPSSPAAASRFDEPYLARASRVAAATTPRLELPPVLKAPAVQPDPLSVLSEIKAPAETGEARSGAGSAGPGADTVQGARIETVVKVPGRNPTTPLGLAFPDVLRKEGRDADVTARIRVDRRGAVIFVEIMTTSGNPSVDVAVESVLRTTMFSPSNSDTIDEGTVTYHFRLKGRF